MQQPTQLKIEDFITQRITEMNQFYTQLNLVSPLQQNLQILQSFNQPSHQSSFQFQQSIQLSPPQPMVSQRANSPQPNFHEKDPLPEKLPQPQHQRSQQPKDHNENQFQITQVSEIRRAYDFDEMPVNGRGRKFEDLLEEQLGSQSPLAKQSAATQQSYLKKKSRKFLSHAAPVRKLEASEDPQDSPNQHSPQQQLSPPAQTPPSKRAKPKKNHSPPQHQQHQKQKDEEDNEQVKELKIQLEKELNRQKVITTQLKQKQKKVESNSASLKAEREQFNEEQNRFAVEKNQIIEEERKKCLKQWKASEKQHKAISDSQMQKEKEEIAELKQQIKSLKDYAQMNDNSYHQQITKQTYPLKLRLKHQVDHLSHQRDEQVQQITNLHNEINMLQQQISTLQAENNSLQEMTYQSNNSLSTEKKAARPSALSANKKSTNPPPQAEIQMSKSAKQFKNSPQAEVPQKLGLADLADMIITVQDIGTKIDESQFNFDQNSRFKQYLKEKETKSVVTNKTVDPDGKIHYTYKNGKKEVHFSSGIQKEIFKDGYTIVNFKNKDLKQVFPNGIVVYYFQDANATQTTLPNGQNVYKFYNKQIEIHHPNGQKEVKYEYQWIARYQNGIVKVIDDDGQEQLLLKGDQQPLRQSRKRPFK